MSEKPSFDPAPPSAVDRTAGYTTAHTPLAARQTPSWRSYQRRLQRRDARHRARRTLVRYIGLGVVALAVLAALFQGVSGLAINPRVQSPPTPAAPTTEAPRDERLIAKKDVRILLDRAVFENLTRAAFTFDYQGRTYSVETSLNATLQNELLEAMDRVNSRYIGVVAMEPATGRVLAMAGYDKTGRLGDPCTTGQFPAASIFKIVTAAAAAETAGYTPTSRLKFNGYKHTLYKSQLKESANRYTSTISFKDSFAQSVNPVFGKIGLHDLGKTLLEQYGAAFGFNRSIDFEIPFAVGRLTVAAEPYNWAEIASGFNRQTTLSPLHGALLAATILNEGRLIEPTIVDRITDPDGSVIYRSAPAFLNQAISDRASAVVNRLMLATIKSGTGRKTFRGQQRNETLARLSIGGKTGSIFNRAHDARFDWFVGFAAEKKGAAKLVVAAVVAHEEYIGVRAAQYARLAIQTYFKNYFAKTRTTGDNASS